MSDHTLSSTPTLLNNLELGVEVSKNVLSSFRGLFNDANLVEKIEGRINNMDNGIHKQLMQAALRRILHLTSSAEQVKSTARKKLLRLMTHVEDSQNTTQQA